MMILDRVEFSDLVSRLFFHFFSKKKNINISYTLHGIDDYDDESLCKFINEFFFRRCVCNIHALGYKMNI